MLVKQKHINTQQHILTNSKTMLNNYINNTKILKNLNHTILINNTFYIAIFENNM